MAHLGAPDDPLTYRLAAEQYEQGLEDEPAKMDPRVLPFIGLRHLQRQAAEEVESETLRNVLDHPAEYEPLLFAAVHQWANENGEYHTLRLPALRIFIALLGEIGGPERIADLLEMSDIDDDPTSLHVHWALWRMGQRFPVETLKALRSAVRGASSTMRCGLAEQLYLLPELYEQRGPVQHLVTCARSRN